MKVSVVVPVHDIGQRIVRLLDSLQAQTIGADDLEVVLVDDGSTDDTVSVLRAEAAWRPHHVVLSIPASGWPGRPRNVGLDHAQGDYVFFADHDDELFPDALRRLHSMAVEDAADVVYGKVVRVGARTPYWPLARRDVHGADVVDDHLLESRSTHKLYLRAFLVEHDVRFLEGRVSLEDHHFMGQVLSQSPRVSVLASYPCYRWIRHGDGSNASAHSTDLTAYYHYFSESVRLLQGPDAEPRVRRAIAAVGVDRMLLPVRPRAWAALSRAEQRQAVDLLRRFVETCVPPDVDASLGVLKRAVVRSLRAGDRAGFETAQQVRADMRHRVQLERAAWQDSALHLRVSATLTDRASRPVTVRDGGERPVATGGPFDTRLLADMPRWDDAAHVEVTVRHRQSGVEWPLPAESRALRPTGGDGPLGAVCEAVVDPGHGWFGQPLDPGVWQVCVRSVMLGESRNVDLRLTDGSELPAEPVTTEGAQVLAHLDGTQRMLLTVSEAGHAAVPPTPSHPFRLHRADWRRGRLVVEVETAADASARTVVVRRRGQDVGTQAPLRRRRARVSLPPAHRGDLLDVYVLGALGDEPEREHRLGFGSPQLPPTGPATVYETLHGSASLRSRGDARPPTLARRVLQRVRRGRARRGW